MSESNTNIPKRDRNKVFKDEQAEAIYIAKDLHYSADVIQKLKDAKTLNEISNIMVDARHAL